MSGTAAGAAAARAKRTRVKHDRWIAELAGAGWSVVQASHITLVAEVLDDGPSPDVLLRLTCSCGMDGFSERGYGDVEVPLPRVLHAVSGHTCEGPK